MRNEAESRLTRSDVAMPRTKVAVDSAIAPTSRKSCPLATSHVDLGAHRRRDRSYNCGTIPICCLALRCASARAPYDGLSVPECCLSGGCVGLWLSPDTPVFAARGLTDITAIDLSMLGLSPSFLGYSVSSRFSPDQFFLVMFGFGTLALLWLFTAALAFTRARQRRFDEHRAWMMRSYSLTFAAATVRLSGFPLLVFTRGAGF